MTTRRALLATPALFATPARAQEWRPDRPLTMIVAFAAGGGTDLAARTIARFMERDLGQSVVVMNRPGAGGEIGFTELARARPDGLTIGFINTPHIVTLPIERRTRFRLEDFTLIGNIVDDPGGIWVRADSPINDFAALLAAARAQPETIGYGTTGVGSDDHLAMLALERKSGARFLHVPFGGSAQVKQNLMSRAIPVAVMNVAEGIAEMRQGVLKPLAQMGATRWAPLAEVPTLRELGFDVVEGSMRGMAAPAGLPPEVQARLALSVQRTVADSDFQAAAAQQNLPLRFLAPPEYLAELTALRRNYQALWDQHPWRE
ncbi:tripartite tricarboxylate transporter substrate binding protein [Roseococcus sp. SDR]|uniref:Bug family tripartite tricarboxylate transporter substrate binding protein n=1 Tax=Roseococcus sp. SDR TaxID=2835532 RepID=UPI001BCB9AA6|nr:tripartite tricarboxylate transporter substrate binding protein [Roseococcus sp. SDR]MBS7792220.1 tripartite tricarboxylate transporter substrate binding protein [Roseococcus sp. SDR]MBV1847534.1 tripartite tricarboxylate transporter substrate binding protein [Roseococcus sp. SDR]